MNCHICKAETDFCCERCNEPVCEDCCVAFTYQNQIDFALCTSCEDMNEIRKCDEHEHEEKIKEAKLAKKKKRNDAQRERYWKPENVDKRLLAKKKRQHLEIERRKKAMSETFKLVNSMFKGNK